MALIVEDGTGLDDADSYISLADARTFAANYGITLPADDTEAEITLRQGTQYVDLQEDCFVGDRLTDTQALAYPRDDDSGMPKALGKATVYAAAEFALGTDVRATDDGKSIASEEVTGAVAVSYFNNGKTGGTVTITRAMDALKSLLVNCKNNGFEFGVYR